ncbi:MAG: hypothetical protein KDK66_08175 [Deltaproteobacteria bacterium]|nr:hypothetical protein [Deltaproteobacteria bacterium]
MSTRMQIIIDDYELEQFKRAAYQSKQTLSEWVRGALRRSLKKNKGSLKNKKSIAESFYELELESPPIEQMLEEIEMGRL